MQCVVNRMPSKEQVSVPSVRPAKAGRQWSLFNHNVAVTLHTGVPTPVKPRDTGACSHANDWRHYVYCVLVSRPRSDARAWLSGSGLPGVLRTGPAKQPLVPSPLTGTGTPFLHANACAFAVEKASLSIAQGANGEVAAPLLGMSRAVLRHVALRDTHANLRRLALPYSIG